MSEFITRRKLITTGLTAAVASPDLRPLPTSPTIMAS